MNTIVIFIVIILAIGLFSFLKDSKSEHDKLEKEGGIYNKYKTLIDNFIDPDSGMRIIKLTNSYMCVGMRNSSGSVVFHFQHTYNKLNVTFEMKNIFIGEHKLDWDFPETMPQTDMLKHIENRTKQYMENVTSTFK